MIDPKVYSLIKVSETGSYTPVSYTHLDVYKRQLRSCPSAGRKRPPDQEKDSIEKTIEQNKRLLSDAGRWLFQYLGIHSEYVTCAD